MLGRALPQAQRVFLTIRRDPKSHHEAVLPDVHAVEEPRPRSRSSSGADCHVRRFPVVSATNRRLTLIGSCIDSVSQADPEAMTWLTKGLDKFLERDQDRALFDLPAQA